MGGSPTMADEGGIKDFFSNVGEKITKYSEETYDKAKKTAKDLSDSAKKQFDKGLDRVNDNIKPKDTLEKIKDLLPKIPNN